jgi:hypothetical protein
VLAICLHPLTNGDLLGCLIFLGYGFVLKTVILKPRMIMGKPIIYKESCFLPQDFHVRL